MLDEHIGYLLDGQRTTLFREALAAATNPGDVVADIGSGSGILGLLCLKAGASRVHVIERDIIIEVARETFERAGVSSQVVLHRAVAGRIDLPEKVDLIVCDHVGHFGFDYGLFTLLNDARERFLKEDGRIVPQSLRLHMAPVEAGEAWMKMARWQSDVVPEEFRWVHSLSSNTKHSVLFAAENMLDYPAESEDFVSLTQLPEFIKFSHSFNVSRPSSLHGLVGFFDCKLFGRVGITNSPSASTAIDRHQAFLPLPESVYCLANDVVDVVVTARPEQRLITWDVNLPRQGKKFRQSTLRGTLLRFEHNRYYSRTPVPTMAAKARSIILSYCDGARKSGEIFDLVRQDHPTLLPSADELARFIAQTLEADTE